jgi:hypothetical protein
LIFTLSKPRRVGFLIFPSSHFSLAKIRLYKDLDKQKRNCRIQVDSSRSTAHQ